jgi:hypothetical protein
MRIESFLTTPAAGSDGNDVRIPESTCNGSASPFFRQMETIRIAMRQENSDAKLEPDSPKPNESESLENPLKQVSSAASPYGNHSDTSTPVGAVKQETMSAGASQDKGASGQGSVKAKALFAKKRPKRFYCAVFHAGVFLLAC